MSGNDKAALRKGDGPRADRLRPVAGRHNARLKELRLAFRGAQLTAHGECAIEGIKLVEEALRHAQQVVTIFFSDAARPLAEKLLPQISDRTETLSSCRMPCSIPLCRATRRRALRLWSSCEAFPPRNCSSESSDGAIRSRGWITGPRQSWDDPALGRGLRRSRRFSD